MDDPVLSLFYIMYLLIDYYARENYSWSNNGFEYSQFLQVLIEYWQILATCTFLLTFTSSKIYTLWTKVIMLVFITINWAHKIVVSLPDDECIMWCDLNKYLIEWVLKLLMRTLEFVWVLPKLLLKMPTGLLCVSVLIHLPPSW